MGTPLRCADILGRWGGDEFVAIATNAEESNTEHIVSRLLDNTKIICYH